MGQFRKLVPCAFGHQSIYVFVFDGNWSNTTKLREDGGPPGIQTPNARFVV